VIHAVYIVAVVNQRTVIAAARTYARSSSIHGNLPRGRKEAQGDEKDQQLTRWLAIGCNASAFTTSGDLQSVRSAAGIAAATKQAATRGEQQQTLV